MNSTATSSDRIPSHSRSRSGDGFVARYATAATLATFLVTGVTGVLLFYHVGGQYLRTAHDWVGMAFVVASVLHVVRNWNACVKLLKKPRAQAVLLPVAGITAACILADSQSAGSYNGGRGRWHGEAAPTTTEQAADGIG